MEKINLKVNDIFSQAWKGCQKPMWFRILNIDRITNSIEAGFEVGQVMIQLLER